MAKRTLRRREWILIVGGAAVLAAAALTPVCREALRKYERSGNQLQLAQDRLQGALGLQAAIEEERSGQNAIMGRINARDARFDLFSFTNKCLRDLRLEARANLERRQLGGLDGVQITMNGVSMQQLIDLLYALYDSKNLIVLQRMDHLRVARDGKGLDCLVTFVSPKA